MNAFLLCTVRTHIQQKGLKIVNPFLFELAVLSFFFRSLLFFPSASRNYCSVLLLFTLIMLSKSIIFQPWETSAVIFFYNSIADTQ